MYFLKLSKLAFSVTAHLLEVLCIIKGKEMFFYKGRSLVLGSKYSCYHNHIKNTGYSSYKFNDHEVDIKSSFSFQLKMIIR